MRRIYIVDIHGLYARARVGRDTLYGTARYEIFLEGAGVEFGEEVDVVGVFFPVRFGIVGPEAAHDSFEQGADEIVCYWFGAALDGRAGLGKARVALGRVEPLVSVGETEIAQAAGPEIGGIVPRVMRQRY